MRKSPDEPKLSQIEEGWNVRPLESADCQSFLFFPCFIERHLALESYEILYIL
jgi:hypothetical protein